MADTTHTFRMSEDRKAKVLEAMEASGLEKKEWFERVMQMHELEQAKNVIPEFAVDVKEMEAHISRVQELVVSIAKRAYNKQLLVEKEVEDKQKEQQEIIAALKEKVKEAVTQENQYKERWQTVITERQALEGKYKELQSLHQTTATTLASIHNRLEDLREAEEAAEAAEQKANELEQENKNLLRTNQNLSDRLKDVENTLLTERKEYKADKVHIEESHKGDIEKLHTLLTNDKEREVQAAVNKWQAKVSDIKEQHAAKVESLYGQMENLRAEYEKKLDALRDQLAASANAGASSTTKKTNE